MMVMSTKKKGAKKAEEVEGSFFITE